RSSARSAGTERSPRPPGFRGERAAERGISNGRAAACIGQGPGRSPQGIPPMSALPSVRARALLCLVGLSVLVLLATIAGAQTYRLSRFPREGIVGSVRDFRVHPSGTQVLFRVDARVAGEFELYRAPIEGGAHPTPVVQLTLPRAVVSYEFTPDG